MAKTYTIPEFRQKLAKHIQSMIDRVADDIQDLAKREDIKKSLWATAHAEPGTHEPEQPGVAPHMEPGQDEKFAISPAGPDASTSAPVHGGIGVPPGQLDGGQDLCPLCQQPDQPGSCKCLDNIVLGKSEKVEGPDRDVCSASGKDGDLDIHGCSKCGKFACDDCIKYPPSGDPDKRVCRSCRPRPRQVKKNEMCKAHGKSGCMDGCGGEEAKKSEANPGANKDTSKKQPTPPVKGAVLPPESGGEKVKSGTDAKVKKNPLSKGAVPMAKPPSGKVPGTSSTPPMASNTSAAGVTKAAGDLEKGALNPQMKQHAMIDASKQAAGVAPKNPATMGVGADKTLTKPGDMTRANEMQAATGGAFAPKGPVSSGLELAGKPGAAPAAAAKPGLSLTPPPAAMREKAAVKPAMGAPQKPAASAAGPVMNAAVPQKPSMFGKLFGKSEKCVFCQREEHPGECPQK